MDGRAILLLCLALACGEDTSEADDGDAPPDDEPDHGSVDWIVGLEAPPAGMRLDESGAVQIVLDGDRVEPHLATTVRTIDANGADVAPVVDLAREPGIRLADTLATPDGLALLFSPSTQDATGTIVRLLRHDLGAPSTLLEDPSLAIVDGTALAVAGDGSLRVAGRADAEHRMVVLVFQPDGRFAWRWGDDDPSNAPGGEPQLARGFDRDDIVVWSSAGDLGPARVVRVGGLGQELARTDLSFGVASIEASGDRLLVAGIRDEYRVLDGDLHGDGLKDLQLALIEFVPARIVPVADGVLLVGFVYEDDGRFRLQVLRLDEDFALAAVTDVPSPSDDSLIDFPQDAVIDARGVLRLAAVSFHGSREPVDVQRTDGWLARITP